MTPSELQGRVARAEAAQLVLPSPFATLVAPQKADGGGIGPAVGTLAELVVDLPGALDRGRAAGLSELEIFADTLVVPSGFLQRLDAPLQRLTLVTRHITCDGSGALRMVHAPGTNAQSTVRIAAERIDSGFRLFGGPDGTAEYDLAPARLSDGPPAFGYFGWRNGGRAIQSVPVPPELLRRGAPLHLVLSSLFDLVAAILGDPAPAPDDLRYCHGALGWIVRWSGLETDFGDLTHAAERLKAMLPVPGADGVARPIPVQAAGHHHALAEAQFRAMAAIEDLARELDSANDIRHLFGSVVTAFSDRDGSDLRTLDEQRIELEKRLREQIGALDTASRTLSREEFDARIADLTLELEQRKAHVIAIVKLTGQIVLGVMTVAATVGALCVGVPADPNALTKQGRDGIKGLTDAFAEAKALGATISGASTALQALGKSFLNPVNWASANADALKEFVDPAKRVLSAAMPVLSQSSRGLTDEAAADMSRRAGELGDAMRALADLPDANALKAEWSAIEVDVVNLLDLVLADGEVEKDVKEAAARYKSAVQRVVIYGRLVAEQMAAKTAIARQLAVLKLEAIALVSKRERLATLEHDIADEAAARRSLKDTIALRADGTARGFFVASYSMQAAQLYETARASRSRLVKLSKSADMAAVLAERLADLQAAQSASAREWGDFVREIIVDDHERLGSLGAGQPIHLSLATDHAEFAAFRRVRLTSVEAWASLAMPADTRIAVRLVTGQTFHDHGSDATEPLFSDPFILRFEHRADRVDFHQKLQDARPTPFTTWVIELLEPRPLPAAVKQLRLVLRCEGTA